MFITNAVSLIDRPPKKQRIFFGFTADVQIRTKGFRGSWTLEAFTHTSLVIVNGREVSEGGGTVLENLQGFTPPLHASVKL
jgi:hypothetical protein